MELKGYHSDEWTKKGSKRKCFFEILNIFDQLLYFLETENQNCDRAAQWVQIKSVWIKVEASNAAGQCKSGQT